MKFFYFLTTAFLMFCPYLRAGIIHNEGQSDHFHGRVEKILELKCSKNAKQEELIEARSKLNELRECFVRLLPSHATDDEEDIERKCFERREIDIQCIKDFAESIKPCLDKEEDYLPQFLIDSYQKYTRYFCQHCGLLTITQLLETNTAKCINRFMKHKDINPQYVCVHSKHFGNNTVDSPLTKTELCKDFDIVYECYERQLKQHCSDSPKAIEFECGLINAMRDPCKSEE